MNIIGKMISPCPPLFLVRTNKYKCIRYCGTWDHNELCDQENDPHEMYNLIDDPNKQDTIKQLLSALNNWMETTNGMKIPLKSTDRPRWGDFKYQGEN
jgi:hypothetical protein